jgi:hypothetical protein
MAQIFQRYLEGDHIAAPKPAPVVEMTEDDFPFDEAQ